MDFVCLTRKKSEHTNDSASSPTHQSTFHVLKEEDEKSKAIN